VGELGLAGQFDAKAKKTSSRYKRFVARYGRDQSVYELEAVPPEQLQSVLTDAIDSVIDVERFTPEVDAEKRDPATPDAGRRTVHDMLRDADLGLNCPMLEPSDRRVL